MGLAPPATHCACCVDRRVVVGQRGSFGCESSGTLVLTFDNTFSYLKAKVVRYHVEVSRSTTAPRPSQLHHPLALEHP